MLLSDLSVFNVVLQPHPRSLAPLPHILGLSSPPRNSVRARLHQHHLSTSSLPPLPPTQHRRNGHPHRLEHPTGGCDQERRPARRRDGPALAHPAAAHRTHEITDIANRLGRRSLRIRSCCATLADVALLQHLALTAARSTTTRPRGFEAG